jgi:hypothetical protein
VSETAAVIAVAGATVSVFVASCAATVLVVAWAVVRMRRPATQDTEA